MQPSQHFAAECLAVADALRCIRSQVRFLIDNNDPRVSGHADSWVILAHATKVAEALESLAQRLAAVEV